MSCLQHAGLAVVYRLTQYKVERRGALYHAAKRFVWEPDRCEGVLPGGSLPGGTRACRSRGAGNEETGVFWRCPEFRSKLCYLFVLQKHGPARKTISWLVLILSKQKSSRAKLKKIGRFQKLIRENTHIFGIGKSKNCKNV